MKQKRAPKASQSHIETEIDRCARVYRGSSRRYIVNDRWCATMEPITDRRTFLQSALGFAAGVAAIGMTAKAVDAMTLVVPRSAFPMPLGEWIEQAQYWGGDDEDWRQRQRWHGDDDEDWRHRQRWHGDDDDDDENGDDH
jgi:hypothetical protein